MQRLAWREQQSENPVASRTARRTRRASLRKTRRWAWAAGAFSLALAALPGMSGCNLINPPQPLAVPTPVPTPLADLFDPADGVAPLTAINDNDPASPLLPEKYRVVGVAPDSAEILLVQSLVGPAEGRQVSGAPDPVRLAGIVTPAPNQPGYAETVRFITERTLGQEVDIEQDPRFPIDLNGRRMVQVYYTNKVGKFAGQKLLLNRMMVRQGVAVVDINAPTVIDVRAWLNDEEFAREKKLGLNKFGITLAQRIPFKTGGAVLRSPSERVPAARRPRGARPGGPGGPGGPPPGAMGGRPPGAPGAPGGPPSGASNSASPGASPGPPPGYSGAPSGASNSASPGVSSGASNSASQ